MKTFLVIAILASGIEFAYASASAEQYASCESAYRAKNKADNAAAPEGYKIARPKGYKANFMIECLSK
jgi:hypothetical protein